MPCTSRAVSKEGVLFGVVYLGENEEGFGVIYTFIVSPCSSVSEELLTLTFPTGQRKEVLLVVLEPLLQNVARELRAGRPKNGKIRKHPVLVVPFQRQRHAVEDRVSRRGCEQVVVNAKW
jgi:hypothetical protein